MDVVDAGAGIAPEATSDVTAPETPVQSERRKIKIDGHEEEVDVDAVLKDYQKYKASEKRFQEAASLRKEAQTKEDLVQGLLQKAQTGDLSWLKGLVPEDTLRGWAESQLLEHIDWTSKSEIEREAIMAKRERDDLKRQMEEITNTKQREQATKLEEQAYQTIESDIVEAVQAIGYDSKVTPRYIRRIAEQMRASLEASEDPQSAPLPAKEAASRAFKGLKVDAQELLSVLPLNEVLELLPPAVRKAIRRADVDDAIAQAPMMRARKELGPQDPSKPKSNLRHSSSEDAFKELEKRFG